MSIRLAALARTDKLAEQPSGPAPSGISLDGGPVALAAVLAAALVMIVAEVRIRRLRRHQP